MEFNTFRLSSVPIFPIFSYFFKLSPIFPIFSKKSLFFLFFPIFLNFALFYYFFSKKIPIFPIFQEKDTYQILANGPTFILNLKKLQKITHIFLLSKIKFLNCGLGHQIWGSTKKYKFTPSLLAHLP